MKYLLIIIAAFIPFATYSCEFTEKQLSGSYTYEKGDTQFQTFELAADKSFSSWLHERPEYTGNWSLEGTTVSIKTKAYKKPIVMKIITLKDDILVVKFEDISKTATFKRIE